MTSQENSMFVAKLILVVAIALGVADYIYNNGTEETNTFLKSFAQAQQYCQEKGEVLPNLQDLYQIAVPGYRDYWLEDGRYFILETFFAKNEVMHPKSYDEQHWTTCLKVHFGSNTVTFDDKNN